MSFGIVIRPIGPEEVDRAISLERACGLSSFGRDAYERRVASASSLLLGAFEQDGDLVGLFTGDLVLDELQIDNLAVRPDRRRAGIGMILIRIALDRARRGGARQALLEVRASNLAARMLYEKNGFRRIGLRRDYYHDPLEDALVLALDLPPASDQDTEILS